jgi:hypothetical protein
MAPELLQPSAAVLAESPQQKELQDLSAVFYGKSKSALA